MSMKNIRLCGDLAAGRESSVEAFTMQNQECTDDAIERHRSAALLQQRRSHATSQCITHLCRAQSMPCCRICESTSVIRRVDTSMVGGHTTRSSAHGARLPL